MARILKASETASRADLSKALGVAASRGTVSEVETLLQVFARRFPEDTNAEAAQILETARSDENWGIVSYIADYFYDQTVKTGGGEKRSSEEELVGILESPREEPEPSFKITDAIVEGGAPSETILFLHILPDAEDGTYGSREDPSPYFNLGDPAGSAKLLQNKRDIVIDQRKIKAVFSHPSPLSETPKTQMSYIELHAPEGKAGFTRKDLAFAVSEKYRELKSQSDSSSWDKDLAELDLVSAEQVNGELVLNVV